MRERERSELERERAVSPEAASQPLMRRQSEPQTGNWELGMGTGLCSAKVVLVAYNMWQAVSSKDSKERDRDRERDSFVMLILHYTSPGSPAVARRFYDLL